jgi:FkbM family methyltransferase
VSLLARINRPEYVLQPGAAIRRLRMGSELPFDSGGTRDVVLPWGQTVTVFPDLLGRSLIISGIFDIAVTESIYRLIDAEELAADVGANIGYMTNLMATRVGPGGTVVAFEPQPVVFELLDRNATRWERDPSIGSVRADRLALSSERGQGTLRAIGDIDTHMGLASLRGPGEAGGPDDFAVELATLDDLVGDQELHMLKIDVEGHERAALEGASELLSRRRIRDVIFEDSGVYPTPAMTLLEGYGMSLFTLKHSLLGLRPRPVREGPARRGWPGPNYLATLDPRRAMARLNPRGWMSLGQRSSVHAVGR